MRLVFLRQLPRALSNPWPPLLSIFTSVLLFSRKVILTAIMTPNSGLPAQTINQPQSDVT